MVRCSLEGLPLGLVFAGRQRDVDALGMFNRPVWLDKAQARKFPSTGRVSFAGRQ